uniref:Lipase domain-containing protein n=1 Tax=Tetranychus urticae TaxID=32264 RepID=T1K9Y8_TETUR
MRYVNPSFNHAQSEDEVRPINPDVFIPCFKVKCYGDDLGCFRPLISGLIILFPPISICAEDPKIVNLTFHIANRDDPSMFIDTTSLSALKPGRSLAFYSHGCFGSYADKNALYPGFGLLRHYYQVVLSDWVRGANPYVFGRMPAIINLFLCTANCEVVGRRVANVYAYAVQRLGISPSDIVVVGHSAGSQATHFTSTWLQEKYNMKPYETIGLDVVSDPYIPSTVLPVNRMDASYVTAVHTTFNFPIPLISHLPAATVLKVGSPFPLSHTDLYVNGPYGVLILQPPCGLLPYCSHFYSINVYVGSLFGCRYKSCYFNDDRTGVASSVFGKRGALCITAPKYPLTECECESGSKTQSVEFSKVKKSHRMESVKHLNVSC